MISYWTRPKCSYLCIPNLISKNKKNKKQYLLFISDLISSVDFESGAINLTGSLQNIKVDMKHWCKYVNTRSHNVSALLRLLILFQHNSHLPRAVPESEHIIITAWGQLGLMAHLKIWNKALHTEHFTYIRTM